MNKLFRVTKHGTTPIALMLTINNFNNRKIDESLHVLLEIYTNSKQIKRIFG